MMVQLDTSVVKLLSKYTFTAKEEEEIRHFLSDTIKCYKEDLSDGTPDWRSVFNDFSTDNVKHFIEDLCDITISGHYDEEEILELDEGLLKVLLENK